MFFEVWELWMVLLVGESEEKNKKGLKRKKFFLSVIDDFFFKRRLVRVSWILIVKIF